MAQQYHYATVEQVPVVQTKHGELFEVLTTNHQPPKEPYTYRVREMKEGAVFPISPLSTTLFYKTQTSKKYLCVGGLASGTYVYGHGAEATVRIRGPKDDKGDQRVMEDRYKLCRVLLVSGSSDEHFNFYIHVDLSPVRVRAVLIGADSGGMKGVEMTTVAQTNAALLNTLIND